MRSVLVVIGTGAAVLATALAASGCGGATASGGRGAAVVPAGVAAFISVDSDPDGAQWSNVRELASRFPGSDDALADLEESFSTDSGLDFETDVAPALGPEVDLVWLDFRDGGENVVALVQPDDLAAFEQLVDRVNEENPVNARLVHAEHDGWQVLSDDPAKLDAFEAAAAASQSSLADDESFRRAFDSTPAESILAAYVDGTAVMAELRRSAPAQAKQLLDAAGELEWLALSLAASEEGVRLDVTVRGVPGELVTGDAASSPGFEPTLPAELPDDVLAYVAFHGAEGALDGVEDNAALQAAELAPLRSLLQSVSLLLEGENGLYVRPSDGAIPEVTLVAEPRPGTDGAATLDDAIAEAGLGLVPDRAELAGADARVLSLDPTFGLAWANVRDRLVVTTAPAGIEALARPDAVLADASSYRDARDASASPDKVQTFVYVDVRGGLGLAERLSGVPLPDAVRDNVGPLRSVVQYAVTRPSEVQVTLFVRID